MEADTTGLSNRRRKETREPTTPNTVSINVKEKKNKFPKSPKVLQNEVVGCLITKKTAFKSEWVKTEADGEQAVAQAGGNSYRQKEGKVHHTGSGP